MHISYFIGILSFIAYLYMFIRYAYVKGELLGSLSLMDAYINILISFVIIKKGEIVSSEAFYLSFDDD